MHHFDNVCWVYAIFKLHHVDHVKKNVKIVTYNVDPFPQKIEKNVVVLYLTNLTVSMRTQK